MRLTSLAAVAVSALCAVSCFSLQATAQERLRPIGSVEYEPEPSAPEKGVFQLRPEDRRVRALRILAEDGSAEVRSFRVIYTDGEVEQVRVRQTLTEGQKTALFELEEVRPIRSVEVTYIPKGAVKLVLLADGGRRPPPPPEWAEIACKSVGLLGDRDVITVSTDDRYSALRLRSANYDIEVAEMTVRYDRGGRDNYQIRKLIPAGGRTGPIELRGGSRGIDQIDILYRSRTVGPVKTKMCFDGLVARPDDEDN
jgi:hypothetical protein